MFKKGTKLFSVLAFKCPRCHEGDLFYTKILEFKKIIDMPESCPKCGQAYFLEPGFYYGAMFISYILSSFLCLGIFAIFFFLIGWSVNQSFLAMLAIIIMLFVWIFRVSRSIWINVNVKYDPQTLG